MTSLSNQRFSDYVTSGAFNLSLSRNQISELAMLGDGPQGFVNRAETLERRGLIEAVPQRTETHFDSGGLEYRLTSAGLLVVQLLHAAGLTNQGEATLAREVDALRAELAAAREGEAKAVRLARSFLSRLKWLQLRSKQRREREKGERITIRVLLRDGHPDVCTRCLSEELEGIVQ
jgi:hypothetical protein